MNTECQGIHQSDVLIRAGLKAGITELRREPWLLDFVFASLPQDPLSASQYGEAEVSKAKSWFLATEIPVVMNYRVDEPKIPSISIALLESAEVEQTLADINYKPLEEITADWPMLAGPFSVDGYDASIGLIKLPKAVGDGLLVVEGMYLIDDLGTEHLITQVDDRYSIYIEPLLNIAFSKAYIRSGKPTHVLTLESCNFRETYQIGVHASGSSSQLLYLHSIVVFVLLRSKQAFLEKRGFERSVISSQQVAQNPQFEGPEIVWSRFINVSGYVRNFWPKQRNLRTGYVTVQASIEEPNAQPISETEPASDEAWVAQDCEQISLFTDD